MLLWWMFNDSIRSFWLRRNMKTCHKYGSIGSIYPNKIQAAQLSQTIMFGGYQAREKYNNNLCYIMFYPKQVRLS